MNSFAFYSFNTRKAKVNRRLRKPNPGSSPDPRRKIIISSAKMFSNYCTVITVSTYTHFTYIILCH